MTLSELLIIYFACGAPLGVHVFMRTGGASGSAILRVAGAFLFWPILGVKLLLDRTADAEKTSEISRLDEIREEIERLALGGRSTSAHFEFREVFHRYTGLFEISAAKHQSPEPLAFAVMAQNPRPATAAECLRRINAAKIVRHAVDARAEFLDQFRHFSPSPEDGRRIEALLEETMLSVGDHSGLRLISRGVNIGNNVVPRTATVSASAGESMRGT